MEHASKQNCTLGCALTTILLNMNNLIADEYMCFYLLPHSQTHLLNRHKSDADASIIFYSN